MVCKHLDIDANQAFFIDDRPVNVEAARAVGMTGLVMKGAEQLRQDMEDQGLL